MSLESLPLMLLSYQIQSSCEVTYETTTVLLLRQTQTHLLDICHDVHESGEALFCKDIDIPQTFRGSVCHISMVSRYFVWYELQIFSDEFVVSQFVAESTEGVQPWGQNELLKNSESIAHLLICWGSGAQGVQVGSWLDFDEKDRNLVPHNKEDSGEIDCVSLPWLPILRYNVPALPPRESKSLTKRCMDRIILFHQWKTCRQRRTELRSWAATSVDDHMHSSGSSFAVANRFCSGCEF